MTSQVEHYDSISRDFLTKARIYLNQDDLLQASEKGWAAAAHKIKSVAEARGWPHGGHRELYQALNRLATEVNDRELRILFNAASALHTNFYQGWMPREMVEEGLSQVTELLRKLESLPVLQSGDSA